MCRVPSLVSLAVVHMAKAKRDSTKAGKCPNEKCQISILRNSARSAYSGYKRSRLLTHSLV